MKVAHVITRMIIGGAQENTLFNCDDLVRIHGDDVLLITGPALGPEGDLILKHRVTHGEDAIPFRVHEIDSLRRAIHPWRDWRALGAIRSALKSFAPDVVHTHSAKGGILGRQAAWSLGVRSIIHTVHGAPFHPYQNVVARNLFRLCERRAARQCHHLVCVADAMTDLLVDAGVAPREKFTTVYSGMNVDPFLSARNTRDAVRQRLGFGDDDIVIGKIARLFHLKGHDDVVDAAADVVRQHPKVRFLLIGD
ncbi:MAG: glycosyltransferase, partial [Planctomycetota bacterium]